MLCICRCEMELREHPIHPHGQWHCPACGRTSFVENPKWLALKQYSDIADMAVAQPFEIGAVRQASRTLVGRPVVRSVALWGRRN